MAIRVRLRRMGTRNNPFYRVVAVDARASTRGRVKETLGWYNPEQDGVNFNLNLDRIDYWGGNGAQFSNTVRSLVKRARALGPKEAPASPPPEPVEAAVPEAPADAAPAPDADPEPPPEASPSAAG